MVAELCAAKLLAPYFGTSIQVWAATLAVTLGGLASGYFLGARLGQKEKTTSINLLRLILLVAAILTIVMPFLSKIILLRCIDLPLGLGSSLALVIFLFPVLLLLGCSSPILVQLLTNKAKDAGNNAGTVYGISTLGGIIATFLVGFWFIPYLGIKVTLVFFGTLLSVITILVLGIKNSKSTQVAALFILLLITLSSFYSPKYNPYFNVLDESDGILGNIKIIEHTSEDFTKIPDLGRGLVVNNTLQSYMDIDGPGISMWGWAHYIPTIASLKPSESSSLLLGLGGGSVYKQLKLINHKIDVVEIDPRIKDLSIEYFGIPSDAYITIGDARHYLKTTNKKYDVIIYDAFLSESPPEHLLTSEGFKDALKCLNQDGLIIVNFFGFLQGRKGYAARSIAKTILDLGLQLHLIPTPGEEEYRNLLFVISPSAIPDYNYATYEEPGKKHIQGWERKIIFPEQINLFDAEILTDEKPILAKLYREPAESWRKGYNEIYTKELYRR